MVILNAFSLNMVEDLSSFQISGKEISVKEAAVLASKAESAVGHADTAAVFSTVLGVTVPANRTTVSLEKGDVVLVGQYRGPRLEEGATTLPEGAQIVWVLVEI